VITSEINTHNAIPAWLPYALGVLVGWGIWGLVQKPLTDETDVYSVAFVQFGVTLSWGLGAAFVRRQKLDPRTQGFKFATGAGVLAYAGSLTFLLAIDRASASLVVPMTAMYPVVTIILGAVFLSERLTISQKLGVVLSIAAIFFLSR
jgi:bacterial/archaeal transporter family protein